MWKSWKSLSVVEDDVVWMEGGVTDGGEVGSRVPATWPNVLASTHHPPPTQSLHPTLFSHLSPLLLISCTSKCCILSHLAHLAIFQTLQYFLPIPEPLTLVFGLYQITLKHLTLLAIISFCHTLELFTTYSLKILNFVPNWQTFFTPFKCPLIKLSLQPATPIKTSI